jgi:protein-disulfide isomerase
LRAVAGRPDAAPSSNPGSTMKNTTHASTLAVPVEPTDHVVGPLNPRATLIEYGDFECPMCAGAEPAVRQLLRLRATELRFVFRHFPLEDAHPHALLAAEAAEAAGAQGKFWPMHDLLLADPTHLARRHLDDYAAQLGLDLARFGADLDGEVYRQRVRAHQQGARRSHLRATPAFFIDGVVQDVSGGMRDLFAAVDRALAG